MSHKEVTIYVDSKNGADDDSRDGTTRETAFQTLNYAVSRVKLEDDSTTRVMLMGHEVIITGMPDDVSRNVLLRLHGHASLKGRDKLQVLIPPVSPQEEEERISRPKYTAGLLKMMTDAFGSQGPQVPDHIAFEKKISPTLGRKKEIKNKSQALFRRGGRG